MWLIGLLVVATLVIAGCGTGQAVSSRCNGKIVTLEEGDTLNSMGYKFEYLYQAYAGGANSLLVNEATVISSLSEDVAGKSYTLSDGKVISVLKNQDVAGGKLTLCLKK